MPASGSAALFLPPGGYHSLTLLRWPSLAPSPPPTLSPYRRLLRHYDSKRRLVYVRSLHLKYIDHAAHMAGRYKTSIETNLCGNADCVRFYSSVGVRQFKRMVSNSTPCYAAGRRDFRLAPVKVMQQVGVRFIKQLSRYEYGAEVRLNL